MHSKLQNVFTSFRFSSFYFLVYCLCERSLYVRHRFKKLCLVLFIIQESIAFVIEYTYNAHNIYVHTEPKKNEHNYAI